MMSRPDNHFQNVDNQVGNNSNRFEIGKQCFILHPEYMGLTGTIAEPKEVKKQGFASVQVDDPLGHRYGKEWPSYADWHAPPCSIDPRG